MVLRLYGPAPGLAGLRPILEEGGLPPDLAPLPLLSRLWECGRLTEGQIQIHATLWEIIDLTEGGKLPIISY